MAKELLLPRQGNTVESCIILDWRVSVGDRIRKGQIVCEVETDKASMEVEAEEDGYVLAILHERGAEVPVLSPILIFGNEGEDPGFLAPAREIPGTPGNSGIPENHGSSRGEGSSRNAGTPGTPGTPESLETRSTRRDVPQHQGGALAAPGRLGPAPEAAKASPRARKAAEQGRLDLSLLAGSGPGGRILERDVLDQLSQHPVLGPAAAEAGHRVASSGTGIAGRPRPQDPLPGSAGLGALDDAGQGSDKAGQEMGQISPDPIRKRIASRMMESLSSTAQLTLHTSAPAAVLMELRQQFKESPEGLGLRGITITDMLSFALSRVLPRFPLVNAEYRDGIIYPHQDLHLGLAVDSPRGLMVPVIKEANRKSLKEISLESRELAQACREGRLGAEKMKGGSFTLSNLGAYGIESFTPVLNLPQVAILGACAIRPALKMDGSVEARIGLSLTFDHQVLDGAPAAAFLKELSDAIADFKLLLAV